jgi:hypothetical protein
LKELDELEELRKKLMDGTITEEELRRLRELEAKFGLEEMKDPFEEQKKMNQQFEENMFEQEEAVGEGDFMHSRITDQDNFSELPPV